MQRVIAASEIGGSNVDNRKQFESRQNSSNEDESEESIRIDKACLEAFALSTIEAADPTAEIVAAEAAAALKEARRVSISLKAELENSVKHQHTITAQATHEAANLYDARSCR